MRVRQFFILPMIFALTACAANRPAPQTEYVEVSNPAFTMSRDSPATIWVPKSSVDNGPSRGSEVIKQAYESVMSSPSADATQSNASTASVAVPIAANKTKPASDGMRNRVAILESGSHQLSIPFKEELRVLNNSPVIAIAPEPTAETLRTRTERAAYALKAWQDSGINVSLFVSAPDGLGTGKHLSAEMYDGMGAGLISKVEAVLPGDATSQNAALATSTALLAKRVRDALVILPWYAKILAIEEGKLYINAGHEAGINMGQRLKVIRGGKVVQGLGFAPGTIVGTIEVNGFIGSNGASAIVKDGALLYLTDIISVQ